VGKVTIFVEGHTETTFIKRLLFLTFITQEISINFLNLGGRTAKSPPDYQNVNASLNFLVIDVGGDGKVLTSIRDSEERLLREGNDKILGLQDLNTSDYDKFSRGKINNSLTKEFIRERQNVINGMSDPNKIKSFFSIMEIEAWIISMPNVILKIGQGLTKGTVQSAIGKDIETVVPEKEFYKPSTTMRKIYKVASLKYDKSLGCALSLMSKITKEDIHNLLSSNKSSSFSAFYNELVSGYEDLKE